jgi:uncharacterized protein YaaR (DUF327 family)
MSKVKELGGNLITGQNLTSVTGVKKAILKFLDFVIYHGVNLLQVSLASHALD